MEVPAGVGKEVVVMEAVELVALEEKLVAPGTEEAA